MPATTGERGTLGCLVLGYSAVTKRDHNDQGSERIMLAALGTSPRTGAFEKALRLPGARTS